ESVRLADQRSGNGSAHPASAASAHWNTHPAVTSGPREYPLPAGSEHHHASPAPASWEQPQSWLATLVWLAPGSVQPHSRYPKHFAEQTWRAAAAHWFPREPSRWFRPAPDPDKISRLLSGHFQHASAHLRQLLW